MLGGWTTRLFVYTQQSSPRVPRTPVYRQAAGKVKPPHQILGGLLLRPEYRTEPVRPCAGTPLTRARTPITDIATDTHVRIIGQTINKLIRVFIVMVITLMTYLNVHGFPGFLKLFVQGQLARAGVAAKFDKIRIDLWRGLIGENVVLADASQPDRILAEISEVAVLINWQRMFQRRMAISSLKIANANLSVPTPADEIGPEMFHAQEAYAMFRFDDDGTIHIERTTGLYCGIRLNVNGSIKPHLPNKSPPSMPSLPREAPHQSQFVFLTKALRELARIQVKEPPQMNVSFDADLADPMAARFEVRLNGSQIGYRGLSLDGVEVVVFMAGGQIEIRRFVLNLYNGAVSFHGQYNFAKGMFDLHMTSTTDPTAFAVVLPPAAAQELRKLVVRANPQIELRYHLSANTGTLPRLDGRLVAPPFQFDHIQFNGLDATVEMTYPLIKFRDVKVLMPEGQLTGHGQFHLENTDFGYAFDSTLNPTRLLPVSMPVMRQIIEPAEFTESPHIVASVRGDFVDPDNFAYDATISVRNCRYRGVALTKASGALQLRDQVLTATDVQLDRADGGVTGTIVADFKNQQTAFDLRSTTDPVPMAPLIGPAAAPFAADYLVQGPVQAHVAGVADFAKPANTTWNATASVGYFGHRTLALCQATGSLSFTNDTLIASIQAGDGSWQTIHAGPLTANVMLHKDGGALELTGQDVIWQTMTTQHGQARLIINGATATGHGVFGPASWGGLRAKNGSVDFLVTPDRSLLTVDAADLKLWTLFADRIRTDVLMEGEQITAAIAADGFGWWKFRTKEARAEVVHADNKMRIVNYKSDLFGGRLEGGCEMDFTEPEVIYSLQLQANDCDIRAYAEQQLGRSSDMTGTMRGFVNLTGSGDRLSSINGSGRVAVRDAVLLELPILGIFSRLLNSMIGGLGSVNVSSATSDFTIESGIVKTENLSLSAGAFTLTSRGNISPDGALDFTVQAELLRQVPGINILGWMLGKIFEYKIGGTISDPSYRPIRLPKEILPHSN